MRRILPLLFFCTVLFAEEETVEPPKSFAREVLQPFGMPLVAAYHNIRENPFLNIARKEATGLEKLGDFFLTPSRYLFGGKEVTLQGEISPSFEYRKYDGLKTTLSILALPVSEVLGCTFKGFSFLFKNTRSGYKTLQDTVVNSLMAQALLWKQSLWVKLVALQARHQRFAPRINQYAGCEVPSVHLDT